MRPVRRACEATRRPLKKTSTVACVARASTFSAGDSGAPAAIHLRTVSMSSADGLGVSSNGGMDSLFNRLKRRELTGSPATTIVPTNFFRSVTQENFPSFAPFCPWQR